MVDTSRDDVGILHLDSSTPRASGSNRPATNVPAGQKRTRSKFNMSDTILRLPLSRSPLKDARKAHAKTWATSPSLQADSQLHAPGVPKSSSVERGEVAAGSNVVVEAGIQEAVRGVEQEEDMDAHADGREQKHRDSNSTQNQPTIWPTSTKKRVSPDADATRSLSGPGSERQSKRTKIEVFRSLGRRQEHSEYREALRDPDTSTPGRSKGYKRASSTKPTPSPTKTTSSNFPPRAKSVPLDEERGIPAIDLTSIQSSPRRSPSKVAVEVRRAPSVPPPDGDRMNVDGDDTSALLHFTNPIHLANPPANPVFCYTVNFATPRRSATPSRSGFPLASPLSPLTPLPGSPSTEYLPEMQSVLAKANAKLRALCDNVGTDTDTPTRSSVIPSTADTSVSTDILQPTAHGSTRPSTLASASNPSAATPHSLTALQPDLIRPSLTSSNSKESMISSVIHERKNDSLGAAIVTGGPGRADDASSSHSDGAGTVSACPSSDLSSVPSSLSALSVTPISRPTIIGAMKPKRGPSVPQGPRRVTRSVSMKEHRVKGSFPETEDTTTVTSYTPEVPDAAKTAAAGPSSEAAPIPPPSMRVPSKPRPPKPMGTVTSKSKPLTTRRSTSVSIPRANANLKQTSLNIFIKPKPPTVGDTPTADSSTASTSMSAGSTSRVAPPLSPSKIPLPTSPLKRTSSIHIGNTKPFHFSHRSAANGVGTGPSHGTSGRSLRTLSHALDKLVVPPPSRPNTSMGFVRAEGASDEEDTPEKGKGKGKAKDDTSLPSAAQSSGTTFARPTASSLKRATTTTGFGSTVAARMRGRGAAMVGGTARGRGTVGIFGRAGDRASKKSSLPVVAGSPAKGSGTVGDPDPDWDGGGPGEPKLRLGLGGTKDAGGATGEEDVFMSRDVAAGSDLEQDVVMQDVSAEPSKGACEKPPPLAAANASNAMEIDLTISPISADKGKQRAVPPSTLNPASAALHALSESLSSLPHTPTPPKPRVLGTRVGLRSSSAAAGKESPALDGSGGSSEIHGSGGIGPNNGTVTGSGGVKKSSLKILKRCVIFVDVRTEQGDDAGSLFVDMLKGLGARIMGRLGQKCTHIVYKNGHPHTLTRYRLLNNPKPAVVGIAWVVECAEQRAKVDEERFKIDVEMIHVAGGNNKRRRSMLPKHLIPASPSPGCETPLHLSSEADDDYEGGDIDGSPSQDPDTSMRSREEDDLPPLERARRRRSILPGGQTRLIP